MQNLYREQGNMAEIKREKGNIGKQGSGKILPINPLDYESENNPTKLQGTRGFSQGNKGTRFLPKRPPACPTNDTLKDRVYSRSVVQTGKNIVFCLFGHVFYCYSKVVLMVV